MRVLILGGEGYEAFACNPDDETKRIREFLDVSHMPGLAIDMNDASVGRWRKDLSREQCAKIGPIIAKTLIFLGYESDCACRPQDKVTIERAQGQMRRWLQLDQLVLHVDDLIEPGPKKIARALLVALP